MPRSDHAPALGFTLCISTRPLALLGKTSLDIGIHFTPMQWPPCDPVGRDMPELPVVERRPYSLLELQPQSKPFLVGRLENLNGWF